MTDAAAGVLDARELWVGLVVGTMVLFVLLLAPRLALRVTWGAAFSTAVVMGLVVLDRLTIVLVLAVATLGVGGWKMANPPRLVAVLSTVPGALLIALALHNSPARWMQGMAALATVAGGMALAEFSRRYGDTSIAAVLLPVSAGGAYLTTPDTELALLVLGVAAALGFVALVRRPAAAPPGAAFATAGLWTWVTATDARGRPASFLPALACLGILMVEPIGHALIRRAAPLRSWMAAALAVAAHSVLVVSLARGPGQRSDVARATTTVAAMLLNCGAVIAIIYVVPRRATERIRLMRPIVGPPAGR